VADGCQGWESDEMNKMAFQLQPNTIVNNRQPAAGDFSIPEQEIRADSADQAWETCMTINDSWGY
jgi:alpha-L-fucosidase